MGRYAGEDYELGPPCAPGRHDFAPNGNCWTCRQNRVSLRAQPGGHQTRPGDVCGKSGCGKPATKTVWGSMLYKACDEHHEEIKELVDSE